MKEALRQGWIIYLGLFFFMTLSGSVSAQSITILNNRVYTRGDTLKLDVALDSLFSKRALDAIESGITTSIVLELRLESERKSRILNQSLHIRLDHDIWEGRYRVLRQASVPETLQTADFKTVETYEKQLK